MPNIQLANEEVVFRLDMAILGLSLLAEEAETKDARDLLLAKAEGIGVILEARLTQFQNIRDIDDLITLANNIEADTGATYPEAVKLVQRYLFDYT